MSRRGRPSNTENQGIQKQRLLNAAYSLLKEKSYRAITIREVAAAAGMKSAMIAYYFKNKEGLFIALVEHFASENLRNMKSAISAEDPILSFIQATTMHLAENPALSRFIADEILFQEGYLAEAILDALPRKVAVFLPELIRDMQEKGVLRSDLDPKWAAFSLMNMVLMPYVAAKVRDKAWGLSHKDVSSPEWVDHVYRLFIAGCGSSASIS